MARTNLGLFDTPPNRREKRLAFAIVGLLLAAFCGILPWRNSPLPEIQPFVPMVDSIMFVGELVIGAMLYGQAVVFRSRALVVLASTYVFGTLLLIPHALTFPGAFSENGLLGAGLSTTGWVALLWRSSFPVGVILYALLNNAVSGDGEVDQQEVRIWDGLFAAIALAGLATLLATKGHDLLPQLFLDRQRVAPNLFAFNLISVAVCTAAIVLLYLKRRSVLDMWLIVALICSLIQSVLNVPLHARFTLGWYGLFCSLLLSNLIVLLALLAETNRIYARLALSIASKEREREARLMSMDAVAAAMAHEIGQPLAAVALNASASLHWLDRKPPNAQRATEALRAAIDARNRASEVIKSVRSMFAHGSGTLREVSLNHLARETASLFDSELASQRIKLRLDLSDELPWIVANPVQLQRVLINLLTNAMDSVGATRSRQRLIIIRTASLGSDGLQVEVVDSGPGIAADKMAQIFEPFFTTKPAGTGLGLSLSRTIIEEHGGSLSATSDEDGATFRIRLPHAQTSMDLLAGTAS